MSDSDLAGHLVVPASGHGPGVLVLHAWWGLNETTRRYCADLAAAGFVAFAPDLYEGRVTDDAQEAERLAGALFERAAKTRRAVAAAADALAGLDAVTSESLAVIGFSLGAFFALTLSTDQPERVHRVVVYYGTGPDDFVRSRAAYLCHFAQDDPFEPAASVAALEVALHASGRDVSVNVYPDSGHWFAEPDRRDAYNPTAARLAWDRTLSFLSDLS